jgi:hypothetical protein
MGGSRSRRLTRQFMVHLPGGSGFRAHSEAIALGRPDVFRRRDKRNLSVNLQIKTSGRAPPGIH